MTAHEVTQADIHMSGYFSCCGRARWGGHAEQCPYHISVTAGLEVPATSPAHNEGEGARESLSVSHQHLPADAGFRP